MESKVRAADSMLANAVLGAAVKEDLRSPRIRYDVQCFDADGNEKWHEVIDNLVVTQGRNDLADKYFAGSAYTASWFVGLIDNAGYTAIATGDTAASHAGWAESTAYSNAARPGVTWAAASGGSKAASTYVEFSINATATIRGAFLISNSTKAGTAGILYSASAFAATRSVASGDFIRVTPTISYT